MSEKLWCVLIFVDEETFVRAMNKQEAEDIAHNNLDEILDGRYQLEARPVNEVPDVWKQAEPWGYPPLGEAYMTCAEMLAAMKEAAIEEKRKNIWQPGQNELVPGAKPEVQP